MINQSKFQQLYDKVGGVYRTTVLMQKRMRELNRGARRLVDDDAKNPIAIVMREIEEGRIELIPDTPENREIIRAEVERMMLSQPPVVDVNDSTSGDELERRILSALSREQG
jgi:DNA-directed RNA polymerase subunit K/omega